MIRSMPLNLYGIQATSLKKDKQLVGACQLAFLSPFIPHFPHITVLRTKTKI